MSAPSSDALEQHRFNFTFGEAFRASDPVARFVVVLAMASNDWHRLMSLMPTTIPEQANAEEQGIRLMLARQVAATAFEAAAFVRDSRKRFPKEVGAFLDALSDEAKSDLARFTATVEQGSPEYEAWLERHRNVTSHYPEILPDKAAQGREEVANALQRVAAYGQTLVIGGRVNEHRFYFADAVAVEFMPQPNTDRTAIARLSEVRHAFARFVLHALDTYRLQHPERFPEIQAGGDV